MKKVVLSLVVLLSMSLGGDRDSEIKNLKDKCENRDGLSCVKLGITYQREKNFAAEKIYHKKACDLKFGYGCMFLGGIYDRNKDYETASKYYKEGCDLGTIPSCKLYHGVQAELQGKK